ncbi:MAG: hypothetical protein EXS49_02115 [Candidatus Pacebacteria bacterium]|nr:hypothetical protein [Candidatus Paceibacterota bacterium]
MEKGSPIENSRENHGRKTIIIAGEDLVALIPLIRIRDRVRIHIPAVAIPVDVDSAELADFLVYKAIRNTIPRKPVGKLRIEFYLGRTSPPASYTDCYYFFKRLYFTLLRKIFYSGATLAE